MPGRSEDAFFSARATCESNSTDAKGFLTMAANRSRCTTESGKPVISD
jgi:hypothetical protein